MLNKKQKTFKGSVLVVLLLLIPSMIYAACTGSSPTWNSTPDSTSVQSCVNSASAGDTINIFPGTATWGGNAVVIPDNKPVNIIGAGKSSTVITLNGGSNTYAMTIGQYKGRQFGGTYDASRISGIQFYSTDSASGAIRALGQGWRIDHCKFHSVEASTGQLAVTVINTWSSGKTMQSYGLIDNNEFISGKINVSNGGALAIIDGAWADDLDLGGPTAVYIEDNTFSSLGNAANMTKQLVVDNDSGAKMVVRYNYMNNCDIQTHGLQEADSRGSRKAEYYGNVFHNSLSDNYNPIMEILAGTGIVFYNNLTGDNIQGYQIGFETKRLSTSVGCLGICNGVNNYAWDGNEPGKSGYFCRDQVGTGGDSALWSSHTSNCGGTPGSQIKVPVYIWSNKGAYHGTGVANRDTTHIVANRDYYADNGSCISGGSCTTGTGCGTTLPTTCTTGVGFWKTAQGNCSDLSGYVGDISTYSTRAKIEGTLYKCTATNTWEPYYTPYTYPHPLSSSTASYTENPQNPAPTEPESPTTPVPVVPPTIAVSPTTKDFGTLPINTSSVAQSFTVTTTGGNLNVDAISMTGTDATQFAIQNDSCTGKIIAPETGSCTFDVKFAPSSVGAKAANVAIVDNDSNTSKLIAVNGTGTSQIPAISFSPTSLSFSNVLSGTLSSPQTINVSNNSANFVTISSVSLSGTDANQFSIPAATDYCTGETVAASGNCSFQVIFAPTSGGEKTANVNLTALYYSSPATLPLYGSAVVYPAPKIKISRTK